MPNAPVPTKKIALVLQGGGARGAYHVGALKALAEISGRRRSPFQIVCGASVGAINGASIAAASNDFKLGARRAEALWRSLGCASVYETRPLPLLLTSLRWTSTLMFGHLGFRTSAGLLDYTPLCRLLAREFNRQHLRHAIRSGSLHAFCVTASSYSEGLSVSFFEGRKDIEPWSRARRRGERARILPEHLLASAALPFAFTPVLLGRAYYGDGSLRLVSPLSPAVHTGADRILAITTRDTVPDPLPEDPEAHRPSLGDMAGHALDILFNDNLEADHERLTRINHTLSLLTEEARHRTPLRVIDTILLTPSEDLREIAKAHEADMPPAVRLLMRSVGSWHGDGRLESYLLFEPGYVGALIDLGYADTMARAGEVAAFLRG